MQDESPFGHYVTKSARQKLIEMYEEKMKMEIKLKTSVDHENLAKVVEELTEEFAQKLAEQIVASISFEEESNADTSK